MEVIANHFKEMGLAGLFAFGGGLIGIDEYAFGMLVWLVCLVWALRIMIPKSKGISRFASAAGLVLVFVILSVWVYARKGENRWTNFAKLRTAPQAPKAKQESPVSSTAQATAQRAQPTSKPSPSQGKAANPCSEKRGIIYNNSQGKVQSNSLTNSDICVNESSVNTIGNTLVQEKAKKPESKKAPPKKETKAPNTSILLEQLQRQRIKSTLAGFPYAEEVKIVTPNRIEPVAIEIEADHPIGPVHLVPVDVLREDYSVLEDDFDPDWVQLQWTRPSFSPGDQMLIRVFSRKRITKITFRSGKYIDKRTSVPPISIPPQALVLDHSPGSMVRNNYFATGAGQAVVVNGSSDTTVRDNLISGSLEPKCKAQMATIKNLLIEHRQTHDNKIATPQWINRKLREGGYSFHIQPATREQVKQSKASVVRLNDDLFLVEDNTGGLANGQR